MNCHTRVLTVLLVVAASQGAAQPTNARAGRAINVVSQGFTPYPGHGATITLTRSELEPTAAPVSVALDSGVTLDATAPCTATRPCATGWDLRVASVAFQHRKVVAGGRTSARVLVENRGRTASPASLVQLCWGEGIACEDSVARVAIPALASGGSVRIAVPVTVDPKLGTVVGATIDPNQATAETARANNRGASAPLQIVAPELQIVALEVPAAVRAKSGVLPVTLSLRNKSRTDATPATEVQFSRQSAAACGGPELGGGMARLEVPALAPGQQWTAVLRIQHEGVSCSISAIGPLVVTVDPDERVEWGAKHEKNAERGYETRER